MICHEQFTVLNGGCALRAAIGYSATAQQEISLGVKMLEA